MMTSPRTTPALPVFDEIALGAADVLVLVPRRPLSEREADEARGRIPAGMQDRVLIAWGVDITVARFRPPRRDYGRAYRCHCGVLRLVEDRVHRGARHGLGYALREPLDALFTYRSRLACRLFGRHGATCEGRSDARHLTWMQEVRRGRT
jgi:hypothetical protein